MTERSRIRDRVEVVVVRGDGKVIFYRVGESNYSGVLVWLRRVLSWLGLSR